ncbi:MAG: glucose 1-dehydrogenase [Burkholderiales bacterium]|jgi:NAD(P)-dependent dehydrogenase (short-subunit alcohol dehydrogenase family)|nr:glucose 1-dehydrogenase [Burkholderiales bacterium]
MRLRNKVAIVTGGSQGIGAAIAQRYAKEGAKVAIVYDRNDANAQAVVDGIRRDSGTAECIKADCSKVPGVERMAAEAIRHFGRVDILVNNAGIFRTVPIEDTTEALWDQQLDLNLKGPFFAVRALVPEFRKNGGGKVINVTSIAGVGAFPNCAAYCASKGGLENLTRALATELGKHHINVNSLAPGNVETPMNAHLRGPGHEAYIDQMRMMTPTGRDFLKPDEMTGAAVFLASDDASAIHGVTLLVDGGWAAW